MAVLKAQLDAAEARAGKLDVVRGERDRWQGEAQALQARLASESAEREEWRQRFEAAEQQLAGEREAVCAADARLDQQSAILQQVRADLAARNAEYEAALQRLQEVEDELARSREEARSLRLESQRDLEILRLQLADAQTIEEMGLREKHMIAASSTRRLHYRDIDPMLPMGKATRVIDHRPTLTPEDLRIHAWISQRLALFRRVQNSLWAKVRRFLFGTVHSSRD
jgi:hypothetical protein